MLLLAFPVRKSTEWILSLTIGSENVLCNALRAIYSFSHEGHLPDTVRFISSMM